ncbi:SIMPL domain-containing protein [Nevskia soli]|uniref:SIMPL domain-containing protein n=1 Tax=Nevskia soli TaxID=418856 RepID=UPI0015D7AA24|nr:SIMPL domain-containing protein [Nevskia soli]
MRLAPFAALAAILATIPPALHAQNGTTNLPPYVRVHGESTISVEPDQAQIDVGVITQGATAEAAGDANSKQANTVIDQLKAAAPTATVKTVNFSINPNYRYPKDGSAPTILGYTANNTVRMELNDVSLVRKVIDAATKSGANNVNRLNFTLKDEKPYRARALGEAAAQARASAEALAASLHLRVGRVLQLEEGQPVIVSPARQVEFARAESNTETPISPGNIDVHASVNITFEILPDQGGAPK